LKEAARVCGRGSLWELNVTGGPFCDQDGGWGAKCGDLEPAAACLAGLVRGYGVASEGDAG